MRSIVNFRLFSAVSLGVSQLATKGINLRRAAWVTPLQTLAYSLAGLLINNVLLQTLLLHILPQRTQKFGV